MAASGALAGDKYGPKLAEYLSTGGYNRPYELAASLTRQHIADAVKSLAQPEHVNYQTFETLMALEWSPLCDHIDLLLDNSGVFPLCIKLLRQLRSNKITILDRAYGFMCLQFLALLVDVGKIAQADRLDNFLEDASQLPAGRSISSYLNNHTRELEGEWLFSHPDGRDGLFWLLGWEQDRSGQRFCLAKIGGCRFDDAMFLLEQIWDDRKSFSYAAQLVSRVFPGWGGLLLVIWNSAVQTHGYAHEPKFETPRLKQKTHWTYMFELALRYALYSEDREDPIIGVMINSLELQKRLVSPDTYFPVDSDDGNEIINACIRKLTSGSTFNDMNPLSAGILGYSCLMLRPANFEARLPQLYNAALQRVWNEVSTVNQMDSRRYSNFTMHMIGLVTFLRRLCDRNRNRTAWMRTISEIVLSEELCELIAYMLLFPISTVGKKIEAGELDREHPPELIIISDYAECFGEVAAAAKVPVNRKFFPIYWKVTECMAFNIRVCGVNRHFPRGAGNMLMHWHTMGQAMHFGGELMARRTCSYPRCPFPENIGTSKCGGCSSKYYCGRRCQEADWIYPNNPHMLECKDVGGREEDGEQYGEKLTLYAQ
ncbi:hypothetical protein FRC11_013777 [Ceratobasidium sp. 423]|nr:hypothetical protein FRC11_013777 [Ceratobasidium sp. 423]